MGVNPFRNDGFDTKKKKLKEEKKEQLEIRS